MKIRNLEEIAEIFSKFKCGKIYYKLLQKNDNSKQQIYLGSDFSVLNIFPNLKINRDQKNSGILKAPLKFSWITDDFLISPAPSAQLILYPQYPEVRFSGFLRGSDGPSAIIGSGCREIGRVLFWGVKENGEILGIALPSDSPLAIHLTAIANPNQDELIKKLVPQSNYDDFHKLLHELKMISKAAWINAIRMDGNGTIKPCKGVNCGGYTLEAKLGIRNNGLSEPDLYGWEIKQFSATSFDNPKGGAVTLFTPEPTKGIYREGGVIQFLKKYGYPDQSGIKGRINFSSPHRFGIKNPKTGLTLNLEGYNHAKTKIDDVSGGLVLLDRMGNIAAKWDYAGLMEHWNRKHNQAAYIPSMMSKSEKSDVLYRYGHKIYLAEKTDFALFLKACMASYIYYDPGIKLELQNGTEKAKRRNQFRIGFRNLDSLYFSWKLKDLFSA